MKKKGISAIVATVLIVLITVSSVAIIWIAIVPMINLGNLEGEHFAVLVITSESGYTVWDEDLQSMSVQVNRGDDDLDIIGIQFVFNFEGTSISKIVYDVPEKIS